MPILVNKKIGETPLQAIQKIKNKAPKYALSKMAYAGRLDPMAQGLLVVLVDEECKDREKFQKLKKKYEFEVLFGISTDTFDVMGKIQKVCTCKITKEGLIKVLSKYKGSLKQEYPPFSSPRVKGKPLFWWAREKKLHEIKIPTKNITINSARLLKGSQISSKDLLKTVHRRIRKAKGNFRQDDILKLWNKNLKNKNINFPTFKLEISCSSGTYVRSIASSLGKDLKCETLALSIKRTQVGNYKL